MLISTPQDWGNVVRDRRKDLGLTQAELAERAGMSRQWILRFEAGYAGTAQLDALAKLLAVLRLDVEISEAGDEDPDPTFMDIVDPWENAR